MSAMLDAALEYAARGWAVLPLEVGGKRPINAHGCKDATTDADQVRAWWTETPDANVGVATGAVSGITVLDVDKRPDKDGYATLRELSIDVTTTPMQVTQSGGIQLVFAYSPDVKNTAGAIGAGLDTRGDGGYVVVPPSVVEGRPYVWITRPFDGVPFAPVPPVVIERLGATDGPRPRRSTAEWLELLNGVGEGRRQDTLPKIVGKLYREVPDLARELAHAWAERCDPPLSPAEVDACCDRIEAKEAARPTTAHEDDPGGERYTDIANAARLAVEAAGRVAHVEEMKDRFYVYDGVRLNLEARTALVPDVKRVALRLFAEAAVIEKEAAEREKALRTASGNMSQDATRAEEEEIKRLGERAEKRRGGAMRMESRDGAYAAIELMKAEPSVRVRVEQLDAHPTWLNTPTGTLDLLTGEVWPHRFEDYLTKVTGAAYDPAASCPRWDAFLREVIPSEAVRAFLQRSIGYALTDLTVEQCLWFLYGLGRNGKSTFINAVRAVLGDYATATRASTLMVKQHGDDKRNDVAVLRGARFVSATEAEDGQQMAEALIKEITGQDPVTARMLYAEFFTFVPTFKIMLAANHKPAVRGTDLAIWRRIHLVPFTVTVPEDRIDRGLATALAGEGSGILNWAIAGLRDWRQGGLRPPDEVRAATAAYRAESDPLGEFFEDHVVVDPRHEVTSADLYQTYKRWAEANGVRFPLTQKRLGMALAERGYQRTMDGHGGRRWRGLRVRA